MVFDLQKQKSLKGVLLPHGLQVWISELEYCHTMCSLAQISPTVTNFNRGSYVTVGTTAADKVWLMAVRL